jgi:excinuclease ABC subunit C
LSDLKGKRVRIWSAQRGDRKKLLDLAEENAREKLASRRRWKEDSAAILEELRTVLRLPRLPKRIAAVDISNIQGRHAVGSVVVFNDGKPDKASYRRYRVREKTEPDDPAMMAEVVGRFFDDEPDIAGSLDLLVLDGGKGQLSRIVALLEEKELFASLPLMALAKETEADVRAEGRGAFDKIYLPGRKNPLFLNRMPHILYLLQRLRDEAHRFAISYYKKRHITKTLASLLDEIPGIGPKRKQTLLSHFGSAEALRQATLKELESVSGVPANVARMIFEHFHPDAQSQADDD